MAGRRKQRLLFDITPSDVMDGVRNDYGLSKPSRNKRQRTGLASGGGNADYHFRTQETYFKDVEWAWDIFRNDMIVGQAIRRVTTNIIREGITLDPQTDSEDFNQLVRDRWSTWGSDPDKCDSAGKFTFNEIEWLTLLNVLVAGDIVHLPLDPVLNGGTVTVPGQLQAVENYRIKTPLSAKKRNRQSLDRKSKSEIVLGVEINEAGQHEQYWITKRQIGIAQHPKKVEEIQKFRVRDQFGNRILFHVYMPDRFSQTRGMSVFNAPGNTITMHDDIQVGTMLKQQLASTFAIFRERSTDFEGNKPPAFGAETTQTRSDGSTQTIQGVSPAMIVNGEIGEKLRGFAPSIPAAEYFEHIRMLLMIIAANLDMPVQMMLLDPSDTNFSSWRGAVDQARLRYRQIQKHFSQKLHRPCYEWKLREWMEHDADVAKLAREVSNPFAHGWNPPRWPYIEPVKDTNANKIRKQNLQISPRRQAAENGDEWTEIANETVVDNTMAIRMALESAQQLNSEFNPEHPIDWRDVLFLSEKSASKGRSTQPGAQPNAN